MTIETLAASFVSGVVVGAGALWGYWKAIPMAKKKAAFNSLAKDLDDGEITLSEFMKAIGMLF
jgi:hypothetical protein